MTATGRVLGLDLGERRIGVAVTDSGRSVATGVDTILRSGQRATDHQAVAAAVDEHDAVAVVVGLPLSLDGSAGPAARSVLAETDELRRVVGVEIHTVDERLSTVAAAGRLREGGRRGRRQRQVVDRTAAALLLQTWIDRQRSVPGE